MGQPHLEPRTSCIETIEPRLSEWDCVHEHVIDIQLKDVVINMKAKFFSITQFSVQQSCKVFAD